jgi:cell volume regulation protein A
VHSEPVLLAQGWLVSFFVILLIGTFGGKFANKMEVPDVVVYILIGLVLGPIGLSVIHISSQSVGNQIILLFGASFIIFHGGMITNLQILRKVWITIALLSTFGVVITAIAVAVAAAVVLKIPFIVALLLGAILASTDPAALVPIFQKFSIRQKVAQTVISESAFTDATGAIMTTVVFGVITSQAAIGWGEIGLQFLWLCGGGILVGVCIGYVSAFAISENDRKLLRDFTPMVTILTVLAAYLIAEHWLHASGFMAVFVAGIIVGNAKTFNLQILPKEEKEALDFINVISLKLRMLIFVLLGSQVDFHVLVEHGFSAILIACAFILIARPLTVLFCLLPDRKANWKRNEILFFFWTRETGVIAAALVGIAASAKVPYADLLSSVTFVCILATLLLQAGTTPAVAKRLHLLTGRNR